MSVGVLVDRFFHLVGHLVIGGTESPVHLRAVFPFVEAELEVGFYVLPAIGFGATEGEYGHLVG